MTTDMEIDGTTYQAIAIGLSDIENELTFRRLKASDRTFSWSRREELRTRLREGRGLVVTPTGDWRKAIFTDVRNELVLICKPATEYCWICFTPAHIALPPRGRRDYDERRDIDCPRCGRFTMTETARDSLRERATTRRDDIPNLSYAIRRLSDGKEWPLIDRATLSELLKTSRPSIASQEILLAKWVGAECGGAPGRQITVAYPSDLAAVVGAVDDNGVRFLAKEMETAGLLTKGASAADCLALGLTAAGWDLAQGPAIPSGRSAPIQTLRRAVILTALELETRAVLRNVSDWEDNDISVDGTVFHQGRFGTWEIAVAEVSAGNVTAATIATRAIGHFKPDVALFVGVAGGVKDVQLGDVVIANKVYAYESGKETKEGFLIRPSIGNTSHTIESAAKAVRQSGKWRKRIATVELRESANAFVGAIAAGEKVVASKRGEVAKLLAKHYGDTLAVDMEGRGFLEALHVADAVGGVIRGISDHLVGKKSADKSGSQIRAADTASAFAFELLEKLASLALGVKTP